MTGTYALQIAAAAVGTLGFAVLFNTRGLKLLAATAGGTLAWAIFLAFNALLANEALCYLIAALLISFYSEAMARLLKTPNTTFILTALVPLIPGGSLYYTMKYAFEKNAPQFKAQGLHTLLLAAALATGVILATALVRTAKRFKKQDQ